MSTDQNGRTIYGWYTDKQGKKRPITTPKGR